MSAAKDIYNFSAIQKRGNTESITPHKVAVVLLVREFCLLKVKARPERLMDEGNFYSVKPSHRRDFCMLILKLIQGPDLELKVFKKLLTEGRYSLLPSLYRSFENELLEIYKKGVGSILDLISSVGRLMLEPSVMMPIVNKSSVIGLYLRRIILHFEKLSFSQVVSVYQVFKEYCQEAFSGRLTVESIDSSVSCQTTFDTPVTPLGTKGPRANFEDISLKDIGFMNSVYWSRRQAELFIAQQASLMQNNETAALSPSRLQEQIRKLLQTNPDYAEAHYLSYLNCARVNEFCGAVDSLFHCFDRNTNTNDSKTNNQDEKNRGFRFAALNLTILYAHFGYRKEALSALKEAIMLAQEANDNICLQHALAWLYNLSDENKDILIARSIAKSSDLSLSYLTSLGIQSFAQYAAVTAGKPSLVFELLMKSDVLNYQHSIIDLIANSYAQKAGLWCLYGKTEMTLISSQLLLHLNMSHPAQGVQSYSGEGTCLAVCNVINFLTEQGEYNVATLLLDFARENFPHEPISHAWIFSEQILTFTRAMHTGKWQEAEQAVSQLEAVNKWESRLRRAELLVARGDLPTASRWLSHVLEQPLLTSDFDEPRSCPALKVRALILAAELQPPATALSLLSQAATSAQVHYLSYHSAIIALHLANLQLQMALPSLALKLIDEALPVVVAHGGCYDQARGLLLHAKCKIASAASKPPSAREAILNNALQQLHKAQNGFFKIEAYSRMKDVVYLKALLYNELGYVSERKKCALQFRQLDEQYPTKVATTLLTRL
ncbi:anaphase-promoting complex subunit 5 isoform X1 [Schistocerca gregaria]|uniref:anaphase-promoting complex subunit 5 isoform X1 n=1 Tax=Schistocerca gregaria TaxID=7010 RepID=UPI00211E826B|nr:anaphase-promoting complex subunit 5 isoform X1 [Schistocerca gregaria]